MILTDCINLTENNAVMQKWVPNNSFSTSENHAIAVKGLNPNGNVITMFVYIFKENGQMVYGPFERKVSINTEEFTLFIGSWNTRASSSMTIEVYAVDSNGNKSNTISSPPFEVK